MTSQDGRETGSNLVLSLCDNFNNGGPGEILMPSNSYSSPLTAHSYIDICHIAGVFLIGVHLYVLLLGLATTRLDLCNLRWNSLRCFTIMW